MENVIYTKNLNALWDISRIILITEHCALYQPVVELDEWRTVESEVSGSNPELDSYF